MNPSFGNTFVPADGTARLPFLVTASQDLEEFGTTQIGVSAQLFGRTTSNFESFNQTVNFSVLDNSTPCTIKSRRELAIRDVSVVESPVRTAPGGAWTFGKLMAEMAPTPADAPAMVEAMLSSFLTEQKGQQLRLSPRESASSRFWTACEARTGSSISRGEAFRLLSQSSTASTSTTSRRRRPARGASCSASRRSGQTLSATLIIEYSIPAGSQADVLALANAWHALRALPFPSEQYNAALQAVTERLTARDAAPGRTNGGALGQIRTNDFFALSPSRGSSVSSTSTPPAACWCRRRSPRRQIGASTSPVSSDGSSSPTSR